ncbi:MAG: hypothetical protein V1920_00550, partial [Bacillota bacterium]
VVIEIENTYQDALDMLNAYIAKGEGFIPSFEGEEGTYTEDYSEPETTYTREDFVNYDAPIPDYPFNGRIFDYLFPVMEARDLFVDKISECETSAENAFCETTSEYGKLNFKFYILDDLIRIEIYRINTYVFGSTTSYQVSAESVEINLVNDKLFIAHLRKSIEVMNSNMIETNYYDEILEDSHALNVSASDNDISYQIAYPNGETRMYSNSEEGLYISHRSITDDNYYSVELDLTGSIASANIVFINEGKVVLRYTKNVQTRIDWNLLETTGWDYIQLIDYVDPILYKDQQQILANYNIYCNIESSDNCEASLTLLEPITENQLTLQNEGLSFTAVSYARFNEAVNFINNDYLSLLTAIGFSLNNEINKTYVESLITLQVDDDYMQSELTSLLLE